MKNIDLHIHTKFSDGDLTPAEIAEMAIKKGLKTIAITDHDTVSGCENYLIHKRKKIRVISGVEISCESYELGIKNIHIIGLFINPENNELKKFLEVSRASPNKPPIHEAIKSIKNSGGISVLAHPGIYGLEFSKSVLKEFINNGGEGIEVDYPYDLICNLSKETSTKLNNLFLNLAKQYNLLFSGGSDFHGKIRPSEIGSHGISKEQFEKLEKAKKFKS